MVGVLYCSKNRKKGTAWDLLKMLKDLQGIYFTGKTKVRDAWNFFSEKAKMRYPFLPTCMGGIK